MNYTGVGGSDAKSGAPLPGQAALYRTLAEATVLVTNLPLAALEAGGYSKTLGLGGVGWGGVG